MNCNIHNISKVITLTLVFLYTTAFANGMAPDSIDGSVITYTEPGSTETATFSNDGKVYGDKEGEWTYFEYIKLSENVGQVTYSFSNEQNPQPEVETLTFTSANGGTYDGVEYTDSTKIAQSDQYSGQFSITSSSSADNTTAFANGMAPDTIDGSVILSLIHI